MKSIQLLIIFLFVLVIFNSSEKTKSMLGSEFEKIVAGFQTPNNTNTVWCCCYRINDDISKEGITKVLLAMKESGS